MKTRTFLNIIMCCLFFIACSKPIRINPEQVDHIVFYAWRKGIEMCHGINSFEELTTPWCKDTVVVDSAFIYEFVTLINNLEPGNRPNHDYRSAAVINLKNGGHHICCFGERNDITFDKQSMKDDDQVLKLIDEQIYGTQPDDYWDSETTKEMRRSFFENCLDGVHVVL